MKSSPDKKRKSSTSTTVASSRAKKSASSGNSHTGEFAALEKLAHSALKKLHADKVLRTGSIVFRAGEGTTEGFAIKATDQRLSVERSLGREPALVEIIGDPKRIAAALSGRRDARQLFFLGGIRVRGDMHYLGELGLRLGILKTPIL
ncbi:SCP2 sterol-binding domain-containing protein [Sphingomonas sp. LaA6.9]|uniref:SCP2 sterol-binding domain-containing protein n=1 Tax=Sphingomonas sp. LaA6.9 TaxID=2919914 RepID=UPI001F4FC19A|nr:hypothetical protein [Sphingomonas sp. LaA6.9]MCJ8159565.1 hypothetical protein [Sphingomonas sp. LaA6.9]